MGVNKRLTMLFILLVFLCTNCVLAEKFDVKDIEGIKGFSYNNSTKTNWTYVQRIDKSITDDTIVSLRFLLWGNKNEIRS